MDKKNAYLICSLGTSFQVVTESIQVVQISSPGNMKLPLMLVLDMLTLISLKIFC